MRRRVCYIHIGPHKTGTSAIQWFLKENRAELLKHGYLVPDSGTPHGAHHPLGRKLCGQTVPEHQELVLSEFARELERTTSDAVVISSETLETLLRHTKCARTFFNGIAELNLTPKLVLFPRNQAQAMNSRYAEAVRSFCHSKPFASFARQNLRRPSLRYLPVCELAESYHVDLIARPFTRDTLACGAVAEFLRAIGLDPAEFQNTDVRRNPTVGPFTLAVARRVSHAIDPTGRQLKWRQAMRCKTALADYFQQNSLADTGYCGLSTALARDIDAAHRAENDIFAQRAWNTTWEDVFADDLRQEFAPNDFDIWVPDEQTEQLLGRAVGDMITIAQQIMRDPVLAMDAPWNDLRQRAGWIAQAASDTT